MKVTPRAGQDIFDITIQSFGRIDELFDVVSATLDVNVDLVPGDQLNIKTENVGDEIAVKRLFELNLIPNNADDLDVISDGGVGFWFIENDFIVS